MTSRERMVQPLELGSLELPGSSFFPGFEGRLRIPARAFLVEGEVLLDAGPGGWAPPSKRHDAPAEVLLRRLEELGVSPRGIRLVVLTHLHFDHVGGCVGADGRALFPRARHLVQAEELQEVARRPGDYPVPLQGLRLEGLSGETRLEGLRLLPTGGHTRGHQAVRLGDTLYGGDVMPTRRHLGETTLSFDLDPAATRRVRPKLLRGVRRLLFSHDPEGAELRLR